MISKEQIKDMVVTYWSAGDELFLAESAMIPDVIVGVGETSDEARLHFASMLDDLYDEIASDNVAGYKKGRPSKGYVALNMNVRPSSKSKIAELAKQLGTSQGEVVDFLVFHYEKREEMARVPDKDVLMQRLDQLSSLSQKLDHVSARVDYLVSTHHLDQAQPQPIRPSGEYWGQQDAMLMMMNAIKSQPQKHAGGWIVRR